MREAHAEDLLVDLTPPEIVFVNDGIGIYMLLGNLYLQSSRYIE